MANEPHQAQGKTPVTIVTGFLGSGKTTLLNEALRDPALRNTLVIINEFGEVGLDHALVTQSSDAVTILENGCLCCTVFGDLVGALNRLFHDRADGRIPAFDHVVLETSGVADPVSLIQAFLSDPILAQLYRLSRMVTVVDCINVAETLRNHDEATRQIGVADDLIMTKLDMVDPGSRDGAEARCRALLHALNPAANTLLRDDPACRPGALLRSRPPDPADSAEQARTWLAVEKYAAHGLACAAHDHAAHHHMTIGSLAYVREEPLPRVALQLLLDGIERNLGSGLLRLKAVVAVEGELAGPAVIQGAQHLLHNLTWLDHWPFADRFSRFVIIAAGVPTEVLGDMVALLDRIASRSAAARPAS
jgi:G3E family GTPase